MFELGYKLRYALYALDKRAKVYVYGDAFRRVVRKEDLDDVTPDYLVISSRIPIQEVKRVIAELGGDPTHCSVYPNQRAFLRSRHFSIDQGALGVEGELADFTTRQCLTDLEKGLLRPTRWSSTQDPARRGYIFSATLCGRVVRLANLSGFRPGKTLAKYVKGNWTELLASTSFRWHATKNACVRDGLTPVPVPSFMGQAPACP